MSNSCNPYSTGIDLTCPLNAFWILSASLKLIMFKSLLDFFHKGGTFYLFICFIDSFIHEKCREIPFKYCMNNIVSTSLRLKHLSCERRSSEVYSNWKELCSWHGYWLISFKSEIWAGPLCKRILHHWSQHVVKANFLYPLCSMVMFNYIWWWLYLFLVPLVGVDP